MECDGEVIRCMELEREALLKFKEGLIDKYGMLSSWGRGNECCKWEGVRCSNNTGHVIGIELVGNSWAADDDLRFYLGGEINSAILNFQSLNVLNLSINDFGGSKFPKFICFMSQLQHLDLSWSNFSGALPSEIKILTNLHTLDLSYNQFSKISSEIGTLTNLLTLDLSSNQFSGILPSGIWNLTNLRTLDLSSNEFSGTLPAEIGNLTNLRTLDLPGNQFSETIPAEIGNLTNLDAFDISNNIFSGIVPSRLWSLTNLKDLDLSDNKLTSSPTDTLFNMSRNHVAPNLRTLNLRGNKLKRLPLSIWQFSMLEELVVSSNSLEDTITEANLAKLHNLKVLYLPFNSLNLDINSNWTPPFQLNEISLSGCNVGPHFPLWLQMRSNFWVVDLSNNGISGEVPKWFWSLSHEVYYLNLSNNQLSGTFSEFSSIDIQYFDVSKNNFSGPIPLLSTSIFVFQISQNMFSGPLSFMCSNPYENLYVLDLSNNQLTGKLPSCWENMTMLALLNLAHNNFSGKIPHALGYLSSLQNLHLAKNEFLGEFPSTLKNCKQLQLIDIGDNMLTGIIPKWIGEYHETMVYLILRNNRFHGSIPPQICYLSHIQVLDLSRNNISGKIPPCFNNFTHLVKNISTQTSWASFSVANYEVDIIEYTTVPWKRAELEYRGNLELLRLIDLSDNRLDGNIPSSFSSLKELHSLNLSRNRLTGVIDPDIGQMRSLESLDLSSNQLSSVIPAGIVQLNFLSVLDLSNNRLSGKIPTGPQLQLFSASAYAGNIELCGRPLQPCSGDSLKPSTNNEARNVDEEDIGILSLSFLKEFGISLILGFIFGFWGVVGSLIVKESWRRMFYNFIGACGDWLFVRAAIFWRMLGRS